MWYGYCGKVLRVDLTTGKIETQELESPMALAFIGGAGMGVKRLFNDLEPGIDPLGEENEIIFSTGPLVGTPTPYANRTIITHKSPITGLFSDCSGGGYWAYKLKKAGYDQIVIKGKSPVPVYLYINKDRVELRDAKHLWGKTIWETDRAIKDELQDEQVECASIGPAGENLVRYACFILGRHSAPARGGAGCVAGSKKLKAIAVRGEKVIPLADASEVKRISRELVLSNKNSPTIRSRMAHGTLSLVITNTASGVFGGLNYRYNWDPELPTELNPFKYWETFVTKRLGCASCPTHCLHAYEVKQGPFAGTIGEKLEYGTVAALGTQIGVKDYGAICHFQTLVSQYGMDSKEMGFSLALAMELRDREIINQEHTYGVDLVWGNVQAVKKLIEDTAYRRGFGNLLAEGVKRMADTIGSGAEKYAMQVKGISPTAGVDVRACQSWGLGNAVGRRGPDHLEHIEVISRQKRVELAKKLFDTEEPANQYSPVAKGRLIWWGENYKAVIDSLGLCVFGTGTNCYPITKLADMYKAVTGMDPGAVELMRCGERQIQTERAFNALEGITRKDDTLPERWLKEPAPAGPGKGQVVELNHPGMLEEYYNYRGLDDNGMPTQERLAQMGLTDVIQKLKEHGKLSMQRQTKDFEKIIRVF